MNAPNTVEQLTTVDQLPETIEGTATEPVQQELIDLGDPIETINDPSVLEEAPWGRKADGTPRAKPGRRKAAESGVPHRSARLDSVGTPPPRKPRATPQVDASPEAVPIAVDYVAQGRLGATVFFGAGVGVFGPDWEPEGNEPNEIAGAFSRYFESQQIQDVPPGWALVIALGGYALRRANKPTIKERAASAYLWVKAKFRRG